VAIAVRPDISAGELSRWKGMGYTQVYFKANLAADPDCSYLNGNVYDIDTLLTYDAPLFRTSHVNCRCEFVPLESSNTSKKQTSTQGIR
jgi:hypothetical protein